MRNIFKVFEENKSLLEENKRLKAQNDALTEFKTSFEKYYNDVSIARVVTKYYDKPNVLQGVITLDRDRMHAPIDMYKEEIIRQMAQQLMPFVEFDIVDNKSFGTKDLIGRLTIMSK